MQLIKNKSSYCKSVSSKTIFSSVGLLVLSTQMGCSQYAKNLGIKKMPPSPPERTSSLKKTTFDVSLDDGSFLTTTPSHVSLNDDKKRHSLSSDPVFSNIKTKKRSSLPSDLNELPPLKPKRTHKYGNPECKPETKSAMRTKVVTTIKPKPKANIFKRFLHKTLKKNPTEDIQKRQKYQIRINNNTEQSGDHINWAHVAKKYGQQ